MSRANPIDGGRAPREFDARAEQPAGVLASWIMHVMEREIAPGLEQVLALADRLQVQVNGWPGAALVPALEEAGAAVGRVDLRSLQTTGWLARLRGHDEVLRRELGRQVSASLIKVAQVQSAGTQAVAGQPAYLSSVRRIILDLQMHEDELRQRLTQVASWHAQMWQDVMVRRRSAANDASSELLDRLLKLASDWAGRIDDATACLDTALKLTEQAERLLRARTALLDDWRREFCACQPEWGTRLNPLGTGSHRPEAPIQALKSAAEPQARMEICLHELLMAASQLQVGEQELAQLVSTLRQLAPGDRLRG